MNNNATQHQQNNKINATNIHNLKYLLLLARTTMPHNIIIPDVRWSINTMPVVPLHTFAIYTGPSGHLPVIYTHKILRKWLGPGLQELLSPCCLGERWNGVLNKTFVKVSTKQMLRVVDMCGIVTSAQCCGKCQSKQPAISRSTLNLHCWKFNRDIFLLVNEKSCNLLLSAGWYITIWQAIVNLYITRLASNVWYSHPMWVWNLHSILEQTHYSQVQMHQMQVLGVVEFTPPTSQRRGGV